MANSESTVPFHRYFFLFFITLVFLGCESTQKNKHQKDSSVKSTGLDADETNSPKIIYSAKHDLTSDGVEDKIILFKNAELKNDFDSEHFGLPMKILKGTKNGFEEWKSSNNVIYSLQNNCVSEGFNEIIFKKNFFTIESQTCYDYNILVHGYITFKVVEDEIYLHKYGEKYFDKSNHDREILTQIWTPEDFGQLKFNNVNESFLVQLRIKALNDE